ncbi:MAG: hypothetical protein EBS55_14710 [Flavobacteriaceae bacterium]|nr:hypothetical protein [Flavobacteriaceae bacterium]
MLTYNEVKYTIPPNNSRLVSPVVYEVIYVSKQDNNWTFSKDKSFIKSLNDMVNDFLHNRINYLIINGNLYKIDKVNNNIHDRAIFTLSPSCETEESFLQCNNGSIASNNSFTFLHILGYALN